MAAGPSANGGELKTEMIDLNFLPFLEPLPSFRIYRRKVATDSDKRPTDDVRRFSLPISPEEDSARQFYWISLADKPGYEPFDVQQDFNVHLTCWVLFKSLELALLPSTRDQSLKSRIYESIEITMKTYAEGRDVFLIEPYYLKAENSFGLVVDFHFKKHKNVPFSRVVQQRSLSLTSQFRRNVNFHLDKMARITSYLDSVYGALGAMTLPGSDKTTVLSREFFRLPFAQLEPRRYKFGGNSEQLSQYAGVKQFGPFLTAPSSTKLIFAFLAEHRQSAVRFFNALTGRKNLGSFQGFEKLFRSGIVVDPVPVVLADFSRDQVERVVQRVLADDPSPLAVFILPDKDEERYLRIKAAFTTAGLPSQACTATLIASDEDLKWSIANLALQIFCKAGGQPWQVSSEAKPGLVVGISQSHKLSDAGHIERFFAFSVLTDNSGVFKSIRILADAADHVEYMRELKKTLEIELGQASKEYQRVAIHASFKLRHEEMAAIEQVVHETARLSGQCGFAVLKVNQHTRFFGVNRDVNSLVPYEGSMLRLGGNEFLVWFEGIERNRKTATKAYPGPTHVQILWKSEGGDTSDEELVQELMTLSGANWRGFNARSSPISVYYCHLVAELVHDFQIRGLPLPSVEGLRPWFL